MAISAALLIAAGVKPTALFDEFVVETLTDSGESPLHPVSGGAADLCRRRRRARLPRALLESRHRRPDDLGRHRRHRRRVLRDRPAGHAPAADDAVRRPRRHGLDHRFPPGCGCVCGSTRSSPRCCSTTWRSISCSTSSTVRGSIRRTRFPHSPQFHSFERLPEIGCGAQQCAGAGARLHRADRLAGSVHAVRLLHQVRARQSTAWRWRSACRSGGDADLGAAVGRACPRSPDSSSPRPRRAGSPSPSSRATAFPES